jgi:hypothetical protein
VLVDCHASCRGESEVNRAISLPLAEASVRSLCDEPGTSIAGSTWFAAAVT